jgi:hypothetical protein
VISGGCEGFENKRLKMPGLGSVASRGGVGGLPASVGSILDIDAGCTIMAARSDAIGSTCIRKIV